MKIAVFDAHAFEQDPLNDANRDLGFELRFLKFRLNEETAVLAQGFDVACCFTNDHLNESVLMELSKGGVRLIALRSAGYNNVDLRAAERLHLPVVRVPEYSPYAVAEFATALVLSLNRKLHRAFARVHDFNFSLDGLVGFDMHGKTVGVIGTGRIGRAFSRIMLGFGCEVLAFDLKANSELQARSVKYVTLDELYARSDVISLHVPLNPSTHHLVNESAFAQMKRDVLLINTGRGALIHSGDLIEALKARRIGGAGLDVYEEEESVFFQDLSGHGIDDDQLARLMTFPNVLITSHQAFLTREALQNIAQTTLQSIGQFARGEVLTHRVEA